MLVAMLKMLSSRAAESATGHRSLAKLLEAVTVRVSWGLDGCWQYWSAGLTAGRARLGYPFQHSPNTDQY